MKTGHVPAPEAVEDEVVALITTLHETEQRLEALTGGQVDTVSDRFGDHGLTGAIVVLGSEIVGLAVSCRVLGLGVEQAFLGEVVAALGPRPLEARIVETARNAPVRNVYRDAGFALGGDGVWRAQGRAAADVPAAGPSPGRPLRLGELRRRRGQGGSRPMPDRN